MSVSKHKNQTTHMITAEYNLMQKLYANGEKKIIYHSYSSLKGYGSRRGKSSAPLLPDKTSRDYQKKKNLYRAKCNIVDLIYHNSLIKPWEYFVTLTFDPKEVNSFNYDDVSSAIVKWLDNMKHQNPKMAYVMTPELHKSGRVHWHGVFRDVPKWVLIPARCKSGSFIYKNGMQIFNLANYKYGFTTVSKIKNQEAVSVYVSKYITKDLIEKKFKKRYWMSRNLERPVVEYAMVTEDELKILLDTHKIKKIHTKKTDRSCSYYVNLDIA